MIEREQMVLELKERLEWLEQNASEKDDYASEAEAIRQFLKRLESPRLNLDEEYFSPQKAMKRFWDTYETRMEIDHERQKILTGELLSENVPETAGAEMEGIGSEIRKVKAGKLGAEKPDTDRLVMEKPDAERKEISENAEKGFFWYLARHKRFAVAAVALMVVVVLAVGGTVGAYAQSQMGIFSVFKKDEEGLAAVVNPEGDLDVSKDFEGGQKYVSFEELPEKYREKLMLPVNFNNEYSPEYIIVTENVSSTLFKVCYNNGFDEKFFCYQQYFKEKDAYFFQTYDGYILEKEEMVGKTKVSYYQREERKESKYIASFYVDDMLFIVACNINLEKIEDFVETILKQKKI